MGRRGSQRGETRTLANRSDQTESATLAPSPSQSIETVLPEVRERIRFLVETAVANGSTISVSELRSLMPVGQFSSDGVLQRFLVTDDGLSRSVAEVSGEVTLPGKEDLADGRRAQRLLAHSRLSQADDLLQMLESICSWIDLAGISGSTAYEGAKPEDDLDFYLVTERHRLWISLLLAMATARLRRIRFRNSPVYCFNRIVERTDCEQAFRESREPLFAREALNLVILRGSRLYSHLLASARWMETVFPELYAMRLREAGAADEATMGRSPAAGTVANAAAFLVLGPYLWLAGIVRNAGLRRARRDKECFRTVIRPDRYATESILYDELREVYRKAFE